jgi:hypothetical protein
MLWRTERDTTNLFVDVVDAVVKRILEKASDKLLQWYVVASSSLRFELDMEDESRAPLMSLKLSLSAEIMLEVVVWC